MSLIDPTAPATEAEDDREFGWEQEWHEVNHALSHPPELERFDPPIRPKRNLCFLAIRPSGAKGRAIGIATCPSLGKTVTVVNPHRTNRTKAKKGFMFWTKNRPVPDGWYDNRKSPVMREQWVGNVMVARYDSCDVVPWRDEDLGGLMPPWGSYPDHPYNT